ncbi:hypothetical protein [Marinifilum flexuosum]|uniref:hypothetical protein n=1 Tax=Marinifilum flexuosum TaxID=1117708 RepID=UPI002491EFBD|nr:hypothetical protein [Marinifilum flexuosum]
MNSLLVIHPKDESTDFLTSVVDKLRLIKDLTLIEIRTEPTESSYEDTLRIIEGVDPKIPLLFLGHGHSRMLYGGMKDKYNNYIPLISISSNGKILHNKSLMLVCCRSSEFIQELDSEIRFGIGFGDIPADMKDVNAAREMDSRAYSGIERKTVDAYREAITSIIINSIHYVVSNKLELKQLYSEFALRINKAISSSLLDDKEDKYLLSKLLYDLKDEMNMVINN